MRIKNMVETNTEFLDQLRDQRTEISNFILRCSNHHIDEQDLAYIQTLSHRIAINAGLHGFTTLIEPAQKLEHSCKGRAPITEIIPIASDLIESCNYLLNFTRAAPHLKRRTFFNTDSASSKPCLLTADDDRLVREMIQHLFGFETNLLMAHNGKEALSLLDHHRPDLVILDDIMPELTGLRLIEIMHESERLKTIPVIMLSSSNREQDYARAFNAGAKDW